MNNTSYKEEWRKAAGNVQRGWLDGLEKTAASEGTPLPDGFEERLSKAWADPVPVKKAFLRRPLPRVAAAVLAVVMILGIWLAVDKKAQAQVQDWIRQFSPQDRAMSMYNRLMHFIGGVGSDRSRYRNAKGEAYRKYYGGSYLREDGQFIVCLTDTSPEIVAVFQKALGDGQFEVRQAAYSYDELNEMMDYIVSRSQTEHFSGISYYGIDEANNCITMHFSEENLSEEFFSWLGRDERGMFRFEDYVGYIVFDQKTNEDIWLKNLLKKGVLDNCRLTEHGDFEAARTALSAPSEDTISEWVEEIIRNKVENTPRITPLDKQVMEKGDLGKISYKVYDEYTVWDHTPEGRSETVRCGSEVPFNPHIGELLEGMKVGETRSVTYETHPGWGDNLLLTCDVTLLYLYTAEPAECNDDFVRANTVYGSLEEWHAALRKEFMREGQPEAWTKIREKLLNSCRFSIEEEVLAAFAKQHKQSEDWLRGLMEEYLLVDAIAGEAGLTVTEADINAYFDRVLHADPGTYTESDMQFTEKCVLRQKVMDYMTFVP